MKLIFNTRSQTCVVSIWIPEPPNGFCIVKITTLILAHIDFISLRAYSPLLSLSLSPSFYSMLFMASPFWPCIPILFPPLSPHSPFLHSLE